MAGRAVKASQGVGQDSCVEINLATSCRTAYIELSTSVYELDKVGGYSGCVLPPTVLLV